MPLSFENKIDSLKEKFLPTVLTLLAMCMAGLTIVPELMYPAVVLSIIASPAIFNTLFFQATEKMGTQSKLRLWLLKLGARSNRTMLFVLPAKFFADWTLCYLNRLETAQEQSQNLVAEEKTLRQMMAVSKKYDSQNRWLHYCAIMLSHNLSKRGKTAENIAHLKEALDQLKNEHEHHELTVLLCNALTAQKSHGEQEDLARKELEREERQEEAERLATTTSTASAPTASASAPSSTDRVNRGMVLVMLSNALRAQNKLQEAEAVIRRRLNTLNQAKDDNNLYKMVALALLIINLCVQKKFDQRTDLLSQITDLTASTKPQIGDLQLIDFAFTQALIGNIEHYDDEVEKIARQYLQMVTETPAQDAEKAKAISYLASALNILGYVLYRRRKFEEAAVFYERLVRLEKKTAGQEATLDLMKSQFAAGRNLRRLKDLAQAHQLLSAALMIAPMVKKAAQDATYKSCLCNISLLLAEIKLEEGQIEECEMLLASLAPDLESLPKDSVLPAIALKVGGMALLAKGELRAAESTIYRCIQQAESRPIKNDLNLSDLYQTYSTILKASGRSSEAETYEQRANPGKQLFLAHE